MICLLLIFFPNLFTRIATALEKPLLRSISPCDALLSLGSRGVQKPQCALQSPDGGKYCAILCSPQENNHLEGSDCGSEMSCIPVPGAGGLGICVYPMSDTDASWTSVVTPMDMKSAMW